MHGAVGCALGVGEESNAITELGERADVGAGHVANARAVHRLGCDVDRRSASQARITSLCTASQPSTSSDGSASANPRRCASASAWREADPGRAHLGEDDVGRAVDHAVERGDAIAEQASAEERDDRQSRTDSRLEIETRAVLGRRARPRRGPDAAITALLAVTTALPARRAIRSERWRDRCHRSPRRRSRPPGRRPRPAGSPRSLAFLRSMPRVRDRSRTATQRNTGVAPARSPSISQSSMSRLATAVPTVPSPSSPTPDRFHCRDSLLGPR